MKEERPPYAEGIVFQDPDPYLDYLHQFGFEGVGFSGGETLLVFEKLISFLERIGERFGDEMYTWIYTNGDLVDKAKLKRLREAGLDEVRVNVSARKYDLKPVAMARQLINTVTVEIPAIPEDEERVKKCLLEMAQIGVDHLNVHQLTATKYNFKNLAKRNYMFLPPIVFQEPPVCESEIMALRMIAFALEHDLRLPINYCSHAYKARFQNLAIRKRAADIARKSYEQVTEAGYIRRLSVKDSPEGTSRLVDALKMSRVPPRLWALDDGGTELPFHPSLLESECLMGREVILRYFEADIVPRSLLSMKKLEVVEEIALSSELKVYVGRKPVAQPRILKPTDREIQKLEDVRAFEQVKTGFQKIERSKSLLDECE
jgi:hypothetical protein